MALVPALPGGLPALGQPPQRRSSAAPGPAQPTGSAQLAREDRLDGFAWRANGKLVIYRDRASLAKGAAALDERSGQQLLDAAQCVEIEPALAPLSAALQGGIYSPGDEVADCQRFCHQLLRLRSSPAFRLHTGRAVDALPSDGRRVRAVRIGREEITVDHVVIAAGTSVSDCCGPGHRSADLSAQGLQPDPPLGRQARCRGPTSPITTTRSSMPAWTISCASRQWWISAAGTAHSTTNASRRCSAWLARPSPTRGDYRHARQWAGLRPATPGSTPLIGRSGIDNLWLNVGHGSLGFTLACGSADLLASEIGGSPPAVSLQGLSLTC